MPSETASGVVSGLRDQTQVIITSDGKSELLAQTERDDLSSALSKTGQTPGSLVVQPGSVPSASELRAAKYLAEQGNDVVLRPPVGARAGGNTSDLVVNGVRWDVYSPKTTNVDRIVSAIASKGSQVHGGGVIVDLSGTTVTAAQLGNVEARVAATGARVGKVVVF